MSIIGREAIAHEKEVGFVLAEIFKVLIVHFRESKNINSKQFFLGIRKLKISLPSRVFCLKGITMKLPLQKNLIEECFFRLNHFSDLAH